MRRLNFSTGKLYKEQTMLAHARSVSRLSRRQVTSRQQAEQRIVRCMAHRRAIMALAQVHGWDSRVENSLRHVSQRIHVSIQRLRVGA